MRTLRFLMVLALAGLASAQVSSTPATIQLNTIYAGADGKFEAAPDTAVIRMDIASQQDSSRAAYDHAALAVDPFDVDAISGAIRRLINDSALRRELSVKGQERAKEFNWRETAKKTLAVYKEVAGVSVNS